MPNLHHSLFNPLFLTASVMEFFSSFTCLLLICSDLGLFYIVTHSLTLLDNLSPALSFCAPTSIHTAAGLSCQRRPLQWLASIPKFSNRLTGTFWLSATLYATFRSPTNWCEHELHCNPDSSIPFLYWKCFSLDFILSDVKSSSALSTPDAAERGGDCRRGNGQQSDKQEEDESSKTVL